MKKYFKILVILFIAILCTQSVAPTLQAATNHDYADITASDNHTSEEVTNDSSEGFGDMLLESIGGFVYAIAKIIRDLVTNFSNFMFGIDEFPWEDLIVFNCLPYLDINFFNYEKGAIFSQGGSTKIGAVVNSVYFSLVTLSITILGIGVAITAIKLVISTIAAEKAKYKEALYKCLYTVVMLFSVHILISFVFYLNETIVEGCSSMLTNLMNSENFTTTVKEYAGKYHDEGMKVFDKMAEASPDWNFMDFVNHLNPFYDVFELSFNATTAIIGTKEENKWTLYRAKDNIINNDEKKAIAQILFTSEDYWFSRFDFYIDRDNKPHSNVALDSSKSYNVYQQRAAAALDDVEAIYKWHLSEDPQKAHDDYYNTMTGKQNTTELVEAYKKVYQAKYENKAIVTRLAKLFEENIKDETDTINYPSLIIYCILLIQSISLLINYVKRIFFVLVLALLAPIVVIYDFFLGAL